MGIVGEVLSHCSSMMSFALAIRKGQWVEEYALPTVLIYPCLSVECLGECCCSSFCYCLILLARTAAHTYTPNHLPIAFERDASCNDHDSTMVGHMNPEKLSAGLRMCCQVLRGNIECTRGKGLVDGNINTANASSVHPDGSNQNPSFIDHCYVHSLTKFLCLFLGSSNDSSCIVQCDHTILPFLSIHLVQIIF